MVLYIRDEQIAALAQAKLREFENRVIAHLQENWPSEYEKLGKEGAIALIQNGIERSKGWNIRIEYDTIRFINLMMALKPDFDTHPDYPWAKEILSSTTLTGTKKMDALLNRVMEELVQENTTNK